MARAAAWIRSATSGINGLSIELTRTAKSRTSGAISLKSSRFLGNVSTPTVKVMPVTLAEGRERLSIHPRATGSPAAIITIGMVFVAFFAANTAGVGPATITSGLARTGKPARRFKDLRWSTRESWSRRRRVIAKAEWTQGEANPRFIVTSLKPGEVTGRHLYEEVYCARGDMENRIKETQGDLFADRTSAATMRANQLRLWFASMAYVLMCALRRIGLPHTQFAEAACGTIRLKLLKLGALVRVSVRRVKFAMASVARGRTNGPSLTPDCATPPLPESGSQPIPQPRKLSSSRPNRPRRPEPVPARFETSRRLSPTPHTYSPVRYAG